MAALIADVETRARAIGAYLRTLRGAEFRRRRKAPDAAPAMRDLVLIARAHVMREAKRAGLDWSEAVDLVNRTVGKSG